MTIGHALYIAAVILHLLSSLADHSRQLLMEYHLDNCTPPAIEQFPPPIFDAEQRKNGAIAFHIFAALYMFIALAIVCDDYFVPACELISKGRKGAAKDAPCMLGLSQKVLSRWGGGLLMCGTSQGMLFRSIKELNSDPQPVPVCQSLVSLRSYQSGGNFWSSPSNYVVWGFC